MASPNDTASYASIAASNAGIASVANLPATVGFRGDADHLRAASSLGAREGVYYNHALNTVVVYQAGATLDGVDFRGTTVIVQADNVTIRNSTFDARTGAAAIIGRENTSGLTVEHSTFDGLKLDRVYSDFIIAQGRNTTITDNAFLNAPSDAIYIENGRVANNYIAGGAYYNAAHADAIWVGRTTGAVTIENNLVDWRTPADARIATNNAIRITAENGSVSNVQVRNNVLLGGGYTVEAVEIPGDRGTISNVSVTGNVVDGGRWGNLNFDGRPTDLVYTGNAGAVGAGKAFGADALGPTVAALASGATLVAGTDAADALTGNGGRQFIQGGGGQDWISAGAGADVIEGGAGRDYLTGGAGADVFVYRSFDAGRDLIYDFVNGEDRIDLAELPGAPQRVSDWNWVGSDRFNGHAWQLRSETTAAGNTLLQLDRDGDQRADLEIEFQGRHSFTAADLLLGTQTASPSSTATPSTAAAPTPPAVPPALSPPAIRGTNGNDFLRGTSGADRVEAGDGNDSIALGAGDDTVIGGAGKDIISTGDGNDRIVYESVGDSVYASRDYIADFTEGSDVIDLSAIDAVSATTQNDAFTWIGAADFSGHAGELRASRMSIGSTLIQADVNGDRIADFAIELAGAHTLTAASFVL